MKDFKRAKTLQLFSMIILVGGILVLIFTDQDLYHTIASELELGKLMTLLWLLMAINFGFLIYDFSVYAGLKRKYSEIDMAMYSDPMTGIGNRSSLDAFIDEYSDRQLPAGIGSITFTLDHMGDINRRFGNQEGDKIIKDFSNILADCGKNKCFVGRNGGNQFLALFRETTEDEMQSFIDQVIYDTEERNGKLSKDQASIIFKYGKALHKGQEEQSMSQLVAMSYRDAMNKQEDDCGLWKD